MTSLVLHKYGKNMNEWLSYPACMMGVCDYFYKYFWKAEVAEGAYPAVAYESSATPGGVSH